MQSAAKTDTRYKRAAVSILLPAYNEEAILTDNVQRIRKYMRSLAQYDWELIIVNDGSGDSTGLLTNEIAGSCD